MPVVAVAVLTTGRLFQTRQVAVLVVVALVVPQRFRAGRELRGQLTPVVVVVVEQVSLLRLLLMKVRAAQAAQAS